MNISITAYSKTLIALAAVIVLSTPFAFAHAEGEDIGGYWDAPATYSADTYGTYSPDTYGTYSPDTYGTYSPDSYAMGYGSGYGYTGSGYLTSSYTGYGYMGGGSGYSSSVSTVYAPTNTCTAINSCNSYWDDHSVVNINNSTPSYPVYQNPPVYNYPACNTCGCYGYAPCYNYNPPVVYNPPIAYAATPYVALSAVPYTGLDLGFWGTIAYWGFLILWCLVAAYLVVVKKVQNRILRSLNSFLFGDAPVASHEAAVAAPAVQAYSAPVAPQADMVDDFILSQINRARA